MLPASSRPANDDTPTPAAEPRALYDVVGGQLLTIFALLIPLKLALSYLTLMPLIFLWLQRGYLHRRIPPSLRHPLMVPLLIFFGTASLSSLCGISPLRSLWLIFGYAFFALVIPITLEAVAQGHLRRILLALLVGQTISAAYSALEIASQGALPRLFLGEVTESGQLALTTVLCIGILTSESWRTVRLRPYALRGGLLFVLLTLTAYRASWSPSLVLTLSLLAVAVTLWNGWEVRKTFRSGIEEGWLALLTLISMPLLWMNLVGNLKRGPWAGVFVAICLLILLSGRRFLLPFVGLAITTALLNAPVRARIGQSVDHFFISGGRSIIWEIGTELAARYPLGVGFKGSPILRNFSTEIPAELRHFHNNILNVVVETGWVAAAIFGWWIYSLLRAAFRHRGKGDGGLPVVFGCAVVSWQVAGMVEYNLGDKEVALVAFLLIGALIGTVRPDTLGTRLRPKGAPALEPPSR